MNQSPTEGRRIEIRGMVQGVGFRPWVCRAALWSGVTGHVLSDVRGVTIDAFGDTPALERFERILHTTTPAAAHIIEYDSHPIAAATADHFTIGPGDPPAEEGRVADDLTLGTGCPCNAFEDPCGCRA
jgi:hydrogenase maturation protein HypF